MESMNNKDPFETFLEKQSFSEKASDSLRMKLENSAVWNRPWWKNPTVVAALMAGMIFVMSFLLLLAAKSAAKPAVAPMAEKPPIFAEPLSAPAPVIAQNGNGNPLSLFLKTLADAEPEFNLSFIDRPVNFFAARREYADLI
ncbi:MAG TPA: hypothetical protein DCG57_20555 [Candidatus Riflebacteria bacterium]|jgi:hypothetical protein|nr:hypothetical protein [Candidatus Riflebacteria bacterium]